MASQSSWGCRWASLAVGLLAALGGVAGTTSVALGADPGTPSEVKAAVAFARDLESSDAKVRREAAYQLSRMGAAAKPALPQLIQALDDDQQQVWFGAISALANLKGDAEPALPALIKELEAWQPFRKDRQGAQALYRTALALGSIGAPAIPALSNALRHRTWAVRVGAARALGFAGEPAWPVAPRLAQLLADERAEVREAAGDTLAAFGGRVVATVIDVLRAPEEPRARSAAAGVLGRLGQQASEATDVLEQVAGTDPDPGVRAQALAAFSRVTSDGSRRVAVLLRAWDGEDASRRHAAESALLLTRPVEGELLPALVSRLASEDSSVRVRAASLLAELGPDAAGAASAVVQALKRGEAAGKAVEPELARALAEMGEAGIQESFVELERLGMASLGVEGWPVAVLRRANVGVLTVLMEALGHPSGAVRAGALEALSALGDRARPAAKVLPPLMEDPTAGVRSRAWLAAGACGVPAEVILGRLDRGLADADESVRRAAILGLARLGRAAKPAVARLLKALESGDPALERASIQAVAAIGPEAAEAASVLADALGRWEVAGKVEALGALGEMGPAAAPQWPKLRALSEAAEPELRLALFDMVARLGDSGKPALPAVERGLEDPDPGVRAAAIRARWAIDQAAEASVQAALAGLDDPTSIVRKAAAWTLGQSEERGRPAEARLFAMLGDPEDRAAARDALRSIHPTSVTLLMEAMKHPEWRVREMAVDALARLGKGATEAVGPLESAMREDPSEEVKRAARRALRRIREG